MQAFSETANENLEANHLQCESVCGRSKSVWESVVYNFFLNFAVYNCQINLFNKTVTISTLKPLLRCCCCYCCNSHSLKKKIKNFFMEYYLFICLFQSSFFFLLCGSGCCCCWLIFINLFILLIQFEPTVVAKPDDHEFIKTTSMMAE